MTAPLSTGSLCSGIDGLAKGVERALGARTVWQSEIDRHASVVLAARWPGVPNLGDLRTVDWADVEPVDLVCFGFPCQDISSAGRRAGLEGEQSALWFDCADAVRVLRPRYLLVENVSALLVRGLDTVLADLAEMGYVGRYGCLRSSDIGAPHRRERIFLAAVVGGGRTGRNDRAVPRATTRDGWPGVDVRAAVDGGAAPSHADSALGVSGDDELADGAATHVRRGPPELGGRGSAAADAGSDRCEGWDAAVDIRGRQTDAAWGGYEPAVRRWAAIHGPPPSPRDDRGRLNPELPEWLLGFPYGWVTDPELGLPKTAQLRLLGNAVQPQVAELATRLLLVPLMASREAA